MIRSPIDELRDIVTGACDHLTIGAREDPSVCSACCPPNEAKRPDEANSKPVRGVAPGEILNESARIQNSPGAKRPSHLGWMQRSARAEQQHWRRVDPYLERRPPNRSTCGCPACYRPSRQEPQRPSIPSLADDLLRDEILRAQCDPPVSWWADVLPRIGGRP